MLPVTRTTTATVTEYWMARNQAAARRDPRARHKPRRQAEQRDGRPSDRRGRHADEAQIVVEVHRREEVSIPERGAAKLGDGSQQPREDLQYHRFEEQRSQRWLRKLVAHDDAGGED